MNVLRLLTITFVVSGALSCGDGGPSDSTGARLCSDVTRPISVSKVNDWPLLDPEAYATEQEKKCASLVYYEMFPWTVRTGPCDSAHPGLCTDAYRNERRSHLRAMSAHRIKSLWSPQNFNAEGPRRMTDDAFRLRIQEFREDAEEVGIEWVAMTNGGEPWAWVYERALARALIVREEWPGEFVMTDAGANEATGKPYFNGIPFDELEVHPCTIAQTYRSIRYIGRPIITVTDCTPVLVPQEPDFSDLSQEASRLGRSLLFYQSVDVGSSRP